MVNIKRNENIMLVKDDEGENIKLINALKEAGRTVCTVSSSIMNNDTNIGDVAISIAADGDAIDSDYAVNVTAAVSGSISPSAITLGFTEALIYFSKNKIKIDDFIVEGVIGNNISIISDLYRIALQYKFKSVFYGWIIKTETITDKFNLSKDANKNSKKKDKKNKKGKKNKKKNKK